MGSTGQSISVAMATCNGEPYIRAQLESIAAQTRLPDEIVIGDDRSTDGTLGIIDVFCKRTALTVRVQTNPERVGSTRNFERILARCTGGIIVLSDQDDIWRQDKLETMRMAFLDNSDAPYVFSNGSLIDESGHVIAGSLWDGALFSQREQDLYRDGRGAEVLLRHNVVTGAAMAIRHNALGAAFPIAPGWVHDYWLACLLEAKGRGVILPEPLISYRRHSTQQIGLFKFSLAYARATLGRHDERYCSNEAMNFEALAHRLEQIDAPAAFIGGLRDKASFCQRRSSMRKYPSTAPWEILRSWWKGDYHRFTPRIKWALPQIPLDFTACLLSWIIAIRKCTDRTDRI
jgi:glycosyltransferase involved in cell wall biosynthesis